VTDKQHSEEYNMTQPQIWMIGSAPDCDIVVERANVSGHHCRLVKIGEQYYLDDLHSTNETFVNGQAVVSRVAISGTDQIYLGSDVPMPWPDAAVGVAPQAPAMQTLRKEPSATAGQRVITIGREPDNDLVLDSPIVSAHHARIVIVGGRATLDDLGSTNGTFVGTRDNRITTSSLTSDDIVYFGSMRTPAARLLTATPTIGAQAQGTFVFRGREIVFGRHNTCDQVLDYPMISQRHTRLYRSGQQLFVEDLGSANGTFVNGTRIHHPVPIKSGDVIGLGSFTFTLTADGNFEKRDYRGNVTIEARDVTIEVPAKRLLDRVSLTMYPSEFVGLMGPSGAGKTTLMNAMNGYTPPTSGMVTFNGQDLYQNYAQFAAHLGYVPQDDIIHRDLTVGQALYYTAKLRLPPDNSESEIQDRIGKVLNQLGLEGTENVLIGSPEKKGISGGQRKRVNLAMELLTDPSVLFLDEPTSGLSSEDALMVMKVLRELADSGKAILLTIHQPSLEAYRLMDNLILVGKDQNSPDPGVLVYYGPAYPDAVHFFNPNGIPNLQPGVDPSPDEVLRGLAKDSTRTWCEAYRKSRHRREFVSERSGKTVSAPDSHMISEDPRDFGITQLWTLVRRYFTIKMRDSWNTIILLAQAPIVAALVILVFGKDVSQEMTGEQWYLVRSKLSITIFLMGLSALWFGCSNSVREIVGEWAVYHRERMVNLKIPSYVGSKLAVLGALGVIQCSTLLILVYWGCELKGSIVVLFLLLLAVAAVGTAIGLMLSAVAPTSEVAIALLPIILLPMVILGGVMQEVHNMNGPTRFFAAGAPSRWAFESMLLAEAEDRPPEPELPPGMAAGVVPLSKSGTDSEDTEKQRPDMAAAHFPMDDRAGIAASAAVLLIMFVVLVTAIHMVLRFRDVH